MARKYEDLIPLAGEVRLYNGRPTIFVNGKPENAMIYALTDCPGGRWSWEEIPSWNIRNFTIQGFRLFQVDLWFESMWAPDGKLSIDLARRQIRGITDICPTAAVFIRLHVRSPRWWNLAHLDECTQYADGPLVEENTWGGLRRLLEDDLNRVPRHSFASQKWLKDMSSKVIEFLKKLSRTIEGKSVIGIQVADGVNGENHYWGFIAHDPDVSRPMTEYFRRWLRNKYKTEDMLKKAWNNTDVTFDTAEVPGKDERTKTEAGIFRNPEKERNICDYYECHQFTVAESIIHFCRLIKENWPRPIITGAFYGYFFTLFGRQQPGGHLQIEYVLNSPYIDYLCAPQAYNRNCKEIGGAGISRGLLESCALHGKLWLDEMDQNTFLGTIHEDQPKMSFEDTIAVMRRNVAQPFSRGMGMWYYDFGPTQTSGWWDHPVLLSEIKQMKDIFDSYFKRQFVSPADVLFVFDTDCFYYLADSSKTDPITDVIAVNVTCPMAYRSGVSINMIYACDMERVDWDRYRAVVFANTYLLTDKQKKFIKKHVANGSRHLVWLYAPGYTDGNRLDHSFISEITGINVKPTACSAIPDIEVRHAGFPEIGFGLRFDFDYIYPNFPDHDFGRIRPWEPMFCVDDPKAEAVGFIKDSGETGLAYKEFGSYTSWYCSIPLTNADIMRHIFRRSGAHIYNEHNDSIHCGGGILCVHTKDGGRRKLTLKNGKVIDAVLAPHSTVFFDCESGNILLK